MQADYLPRHRFIEERLKGCGDNDVDSIILLWELIAEEIISIIGEGGFNSLYERSEFLTQKTFPWLVVTSSSSKQADERFSLLRLCREKQTSAEWFEANLKLLLTFTDILVMLIGEQLTIRILISAWENDTEATYGAGFTNEH
ncbi:hypothetical protein [Nitrosomonas supralitoralis]|uniref:Uncharacterized protein n=1 Tax=Nitrosomonas supralitoralis TaxID=2116706 RepID=A0A2P7NRS7_9PROT|nr:hypothetical protein [Nitrosomonas supralitoralis]PSJ16139.1 hypothetical protein C7H79_15095 [Nitrosomonas supralitoralis]